MASWLRRQKKADLETIAEETGMTGNVHELLRKDLIETLDLHLQALPLSQRNRPSLQPYYDSLDRAETREAHSPVKREPKEPNTGVARASASATPPPAKRQTTKRRQTLSTQAEAAADAAETTTKTAATKAKAKSSSALSKTPQSIQKLAQRVPIPSSPQAVTSLIERSSARVSHSVGTAFTRSGIPAATETTRAQLSSVQSVTALFTLLEAAALNWVLIPWRHAFHLPLPASLFHTHALSVKFPDLFILLTSRFWAPISLWTLVSLFAPLTMGWLFNFSEQTATPRNKSRYAVDPVVFNAVKGLAVWLVFVQKWQRDPDGYITSATAGTVAGGVVGGVPGMFVAAGAGVGTGLWEGVLRSQR